MSAGIPAAAALISTIGFNFSGALCFVLAVRGFKSVEGQLDLNLKSLVTGALFCMAIAAPAFWRFTQALAVYRPGLTATRWLWHETPTLTLVAALRLAGRETFASHSRARGRSPP